LTANAVCEGKEIVTDPNGIRNDAPCFRALGVRVDAIQIPDVIGRIDDWIGERNGCRFIAVTGMHGVMEARHDMTFKEILSQAGLVVPDGYPLVWLGRRQGFTGLRRRVYGPELMERFCAESATKGHRHFFYGGAPGVAQELARRFADRFPGFQVAGTFSPPFRALTEEEDRDAVGAIEGSSADIVWVGLSTPLQERWMYEHREELSAPVLIGVGAAFDFHTGRVAQAPRWMGEHGLEWLFRLTMEPRRLWRRYLIYGSQFVTLVLLEMLGRQKAR
jgi:N-acetylglucosaminyldiphosphoundecaprenol N-acetyl-beta-D-mannosaminyltransferase